jgi:hypothetical protein
MRLWESLTLPSHFKVFSNDLEKFELKIRARQDNAMTLKTAIHIKVTLSIPLLSFVA